jgi:hypothetical protein
MARPSFEGISKWENADYLKLMRGNGEQYWPKVQEIVRNLRAAKTARAA